jgi:hypothetical protein
MLIDRINNFKTIHAITLLTKTDFSKPTFKGSFTCHKTLRTCEFSSVSRDIALYMQKLGFEPLTLYLFTFKMEFLANKLLDKKKKPQHYMQMTHKSLSSRISCSRNVNRN